MTRALRGPALAIAAAAMLAGAACTNSGYEEGSNAPGQESVGSGDASTASGGATGAPGTAGGNVNTSTTPSAAAPDSARAGATIGAAATPRP